MFPLICTALNPKSILLSEHLLAPNKVTQGKVATISIPLVLLNFFLLEFFTVFFFFYSEQSIGLLVFFFTINEDTEGYSSPWERLRAALQAGFVVKVPWADASPILLHLSSRAGEMAFPAWRSPTWEFSPTILLQETEQVQVSRAWLEVFQFFFNWL